VSDDIFDQGGEIPTCDGEMRNFPNGRKTFMAFSTVAKYKEVFKEDRDTNLPEKVVNECGNPGH
jgi:hypothetical protein